MSKIPPLILIDGSSYLYRAFHALPPLTTKAGQPVGALYGVAKMLRTVINDWEPEQILVVFDAKGKNFRHQIDPNYKAHRPPMPMELSTQIEPLYDFIDAMGLPQVSLAGVEADDVLGTLAYQYGAQQKPVLISTSDKDLAQLVNPWVTLVNTMTQTRLDEAGVVKKFGVKPSQIIDYLALIGDKSDNVPGISKVGPKTAVKWLQMYGDIDSILENAAAIKGKVGENLRNESDQLAVSRKLVTIDCHVSLPESLSLVRKQPNVERLKALLERYEFRSWNLAVKTQKQSTQDDLNHGTLYAENHDDMAVKQSVVIKKYQLVDTLQALESWLVKVHQAPIVAIDTETTDLDLSKAKLVGLSMAVAPGVACYIPLQHKAKTKLSSTQALALLAPYLSDPQYPKVLQNIKFDQAVLNSVGIDLKGAFYDTMLMSYVLNSVATSHGLDALSKYYLGLEPISFECVMKQVEAAESFADVPLNLALDYAAEDADLVLRLHYELWPKLVKEPSLLKLYKQVELPLIKVLGEIESQGVCLDVSHLKQFASELDVKIESLENQAHAMAQQTFNLSSTKQLQEILFVERKLPILKKTPKGAPSTAESVLEALALQAPEDPLPAVIVAHRMSSKLRSTYTHRLIAKVNPSTKRVHTSFHQAMTATGRLSSSEPNLQNIPIKNAAGRKVREAFIAAPEHQLISADYSQIELRILAHLSQDIGLLNAFNQALDVHQATAAKIFGIAYQHVDSQQRRAAKAINFGLIYGMSAFGLAQQLKISRQSAQSFINQYFQQYPSVLDYMEDVRSQARKNGYVETLFGRRLYLPEINSVKAQRRQHAERTAINAPMQGSAADIIKRAMISIYDWSRA